MEPEQALQALLIHINDQLAAEAEAMERKILFLSGHCDNDLFDLRYLYPAPKYGTICPYSRKVYICPLADRLNCRELQCDNWIKAQWNGGKQ